MVSMYLVLLFTLFMKQNANCLFFLPGSDKVAPFCVFVKNVFLFFFNKKKKKRSFSILESVELPL